ncbi:PX domain-containing protein kinase-like protein [Hypsibius exemplaris]|uniref:PX domain-containing protein kinase-like protein n=1 Tax=Hypsibius exemplaris TaxID=2072580 RepID=A0A1W0X9D3_HYPEX|nr:PX domain-containing protein kinase-like protein [Hypsibius exemplaris]
MGSALQFLAMVFRTDSRFEIAAPLPQIGWRVNKEFATVKCMTEPKTKYTGCWIFYGPDRILLPVEISALLTSFCQIKHPLFFPLFFADARDTGCVTVRPTQSQGSLWDMLKGNKMAQQFLQKSARNKFGKPLSEEDIQRIGRQILEALKFFHDNSIPYGNLSSRNVFLDNDGAHVTDTESGVCGLRSFYWPFILQLRKIHTFEAIDVYCFGHLLYEMAFGRACETPTCDNLAATNCPPLIRAVLESILTPEAARGGMPAVSQLLTQPLFSNVVLNYDPVSMKMSRKLKDALVSAKAQMEERFVAEQKLYQAYLKNQKAYTLQSSEEERKKRRLQALKSQSSTSDNNGGDNNCGFTTRTPTPTGHNGEAAGMPPPKTPTSPPPPPPPMPSSAGPPPPPPPMKIVNNGNVSTSGTSDGSERNALLASIRGFKKDALAAAETADKSGPYIE